MHFWLLAYLVRLHIKPDSTSWNERCQNITIKPNLVLRLFVVVQASPYFKRNSFFNHEEAYQLYLGSTLFAFFLCYLLKHISFLHSRS